MLEGRPCRTEITVGYGAVYVLPVYLCKLLYVMVYAMSWNEGCCYSCLCLMQCSNVAVNVSTGREGRHQDAIRLSYVDFGDESGVPESGPGCGSTGAGSGVLYKLATTVIHVDEVGKYGGYVVEDARLFVEKSEFERNDS